MNTITGQQTKEWQISNLCWISKESFNQKWQKFKDEPGRHSAAAFYSSGRRRKKKLKQAEAFQWGGDCSVQGAEPAVSGDLKKKRGLGTQILKAQRLQSFLPLAGVLVACRPGDNNNQKRRWASPWWPRPWGSTGQWQRPRVQKTKAARSHISYSATWWEAALKLILFLPQCLFMILLIVL